MLNVDKEPSSLGTQSEVAQPEDMQSGELRSVALAAVNDMSLSDAALYYIANGIPIFPLMPNGKTPLCGGHGHLEATTDQETVREWWKNCPDANIGLPTGDASGFFAVDVDGDEGAESLQRLEAVHGALPPTVTSKTSRGVHLLFENVAGVQCSQSVLGPKIDVKTTGGYIVAPPSLHASGHRYEWISDGTVAALPGWVTATLLEARGKVRKQKGPSLYEAANIPEGSRNAAVASFAGYLRKKGCEGDELFEMLMAFNSSRCDPPLPEREVKSIARSIGKYPTNETLALTDLGNAHRFVALHGENVCFVSGAGFWLKWNGAHWQEMSRDEALAMAFDVPGVIALEASYEEDKEAAKALSDHARRSQGRGRLEAILELAKSLLGIKPERLDNNQMLLSVKNGQLDLRSGELLPHRREDLITKHIEVEYDKFAPRPAWDKFMEQITCGDRALANFIQRVGGYCLTGSTVEQCLFIFYGHGANGKSTMLEALKTLMGPYAAKSPMTTFLSIKGEKSSNDLARLRGARLVTAVEVGRSDRLNEPLIKELTGGDTLTARFLFKEFFDFTPTFKIVMSVNDLPRIEAGDAAINRRLCVVPFGATFSAEDCDKHLSDKLKAELPGILAWLVEGCLAWQRDGLYRPSAVTVATENYIQTNDPLGEFIAEHCEQAKGHMIRASEFFARYVPWLSETHGLTTNKVAVGRLMKKKGYASKTRNGDRYYYGITYVAGQA